jgi:hypothetical protein
MSIFNEEDDRQRRMLPEADSALEETVVLISLAKAGTPGSSLLWSALSGLMGGLLAAGVALGVD